MKTAVVIGATGLIGHELVKQLSVSAAYDKLIVITRRRIHWNNPKIQEIVILFHQLELQELPEGCDFYCALGTTIKQAGSQEEFRKVDQEYVVAFTKLAEKFKAHSFHLVSALGADPTSNNFYSRVKGEVEKAVCASNIEKIRIYRPSLLMGVRKQLGQSPRFGEDIAAAIYDRTQFMFKGFLKKYEPVQASKVAEAMIKNALADLPESKMIILNQQMH